MNHPPALGLFETPFSSYRESLPRLLDAAGLKSLVQGAQRILLKPNLVSLDPPPITTDVALVEELVRFLQPLGIPLVIGEGTAMADHDTHEVFRVLGYQAMAKALGVELVDLNNQPCQRYCRADCQRWPEMWLPDIAMDSFLISLPVLKAHSLSGVTLSMKNLMGLCPPAHYQQGGHWKKSAFHRQIHEAVYELSLYRSPDFTLLDASRGMAQAHLWGPLVHPAPNRLVASGHLAALEARGCELLGLDPMSIPHVAWALRDAGKLPTLRQV